MTIYELVKYGVIFGATFLLAVACTGCGISSGQTAFGFGESFFEQHNQKLVILQEEARKNGRK